MSRRLIILAPAFALLIACGPTVKQQALTVDQISHGTLAAAQDLEAQLCFGVADALSGPKDPVAAQHCTTPTAAGIGLTDARHKQIATALKSAFDLHRSLTASLDAGSAVDWTNYNAALDGIITLIQQLQQTPQVAQILSNVKGAKQ